MNLEFLRNFPWIWGKRSNDLGPSLQSSGAIVEQGHANTRFDIRTWRFSLLSLLPWENNPNAPDIILAKTTINRSLKTLVKRGRTTENHGGEAPLRFKPYVCKVPWHTGVRAIFSQLIPRYGNYCGPNWSSGKDNGSHVWDKRPIDCLDFCCYCHDIGYDSHNQAELLKADLAFLECLEMPNMDSKGDANMATLYRIMCVTDNKEVNEGLLACIALMIPSLEEQDKILVEIPKYKEAEESFGQPWAIRNRNKRSSGLRNLLIPYRRHAIQLQFHSRQPASQFGWFSNLKWFSWNLQRAEQKHPQM